VEMHENTLKICRTILWSIFKINSTFYAFASNQNNVTANWKKSRFCTFFSKPSTTWIM